MHESSQACALNHLFFERRMKQYHSSHMTYKVGMTCSNFLMSFPILVTELTSCAQPWPWHFALTFIMSRLDFQTMLSAVLSCNVDHMQIGHNPGLKTQSQSAALCMCQTKSFWSLCYNLPKRVWKESFLLSLDSIIWRGLSNDHHARLFY